MVVRKATDKDINSISEIYEKIHTEEENNRVSIGWCRGVYPVKETAEAALMRDDLFVMEDDGVIVGSAIINKIQLDCYIDGDWQVFCDVSKVMVMHTLTINPDFPRCGYGKKFVDFYERYSKENGCITVRIDTQEKNSNARAMYKKLGYKEVGVTYCEFNGISDVKIILLDKIL